MITQTGTYDFRTEAVKDKLSNCFDGAILETWNNGDIWIGFDVIHDDFVQICYTLHHSIEWELYYILWKPNAVMGYKSKTIRCDPDDCINLINITNTYLMLVTLNANTDTDQWFI